MTKVSILLMMGLAVAACGVAADGTAEPTTSTTELGTSTTSVEESTTTTSTSTMPTEPDEPTESTPTDLAIADLARHLDVEPNAIDVVAVEEVTWRDASLGCRDPDALYAQVVTDGIRIVLRYDGDEFHYHADTESDPFLCADPDDRGFVSPLKEEPDISVPPPID